jgi:predicted nucleotidyltransferase component of viral defense system
MTKIMEILGGYLDALKKENPYGLVLKGGTALALHHLDMHRESEDLDFDARIEYLADAEQVADSLCSILDRMMYSSFIDGYKVTKRGFAATSRYHINLSIRTYKTFYTKIDVEYTDIDDDLEFEGALGFYSAERMFIGKLITFRSRVEFKDLYDIRHLLDIVDIDRFKDKHDLARSIDEVLERSRDPSLLIDIKHAFRNADLRFKKVNSTNVEDFISRTRRELLVMRNSLLKDIGPSKEGVR